MYIITNHNDNDRVIIGPMAWRPRYFSTVLSEELDQDVLIMDSDEARVPYNVLTGIRIRRCSIEKEDVNSKIETHSGPTIVYESDGTATAQWTKINKNIDVVRNELKQQLATNRWQKEELGTTVIIQGTEVSIDTRRTFRDIFIQKYLLMSEGETVDWKFPEGWLTLSKSELGLVVATGAQYVQDQFNWESSVTDQIDSASTLQELDAIEIE
jgi:hypothetical protein